MSNSEDEEMALYEAFISDPDTRLIVPAPEGVPNVEFKFGGEWRECRIWEGYFEASLILLKKALQRAPQTNNLVFPALFNLRHAVEVALKWHIRYAGGIVPKRAGHNLGVLLESFRQTAYDLDDEANYFSDYALERISELASIDPHSVMFRYSTEVDGSLIEIAPECWDLRRLYFTVDELLLWFDGLSGQIDRSR
jgi:hypothetical protein